MIRIKFRLQLATLAAAIFGLALLTVFSPKSEACSPPPSYPSSAIFAEQNTSEGSYTINPNYSTYSVGTSVTLNGTGKDYDDYDYVFDYWMNLPTTDFPSGPAGAGTSSNNPLTMTVRGPDGVKAHWKKRYKLVVSTVGQGSVSPGTGKYFTGSTVTLTATPALGWAFDHWEGALTGSTNPIPITMDAKKTVTAVFKPTYVYFTSPVDVAEENEPQKRISVNLSHPVPVGEHITVSYSVTGGTATGGGVDYTLPNGTVEFNEQQSSKDIIIAISNDSIDEGLEDLYITLSNPSPSYALLYYPYITRVWINDNDATLTIAATGPGTVTPPPPGGSYEGGTVVDLNASPSSGCTFDHWDIGGTIVNSSSTQVTMHSDKTCTAFFNSWRTLHTSVEEPYSWGGTISVASVIPPPNVVNPPANYGAGPNYNVIAGSTVTLHASHVGGTRFKQWQIGIPPNFQIETGETTLPFTVQSEISALANFWPLVFVQTGSRVINGHGQIVTGLGGTVEPSLGEVDLLSDHHLRAVPFPDSRLVSWDSTDPSIDGVTGVSEVDLHVTGPTTVLAQFIDTFWIRGVVSPTNTGSISYTLQWGHQENGHYDNDSIVRLEAMPANGYEFDHWIIGVADHPATNTAVTDNPTDVTMVSHKDISAVFEEIISTTGGVIINEVYVGPLGSANSGWPVPLNTSPWIELFNGGSSTVNLLGWALTDDPNDNDKWQFPDVSIPSGQYLIVVCDGMASGGDGFLHTNFVLSSPGSFLALYDSSDPRVAATEFTPQFPEISRGWSYSQFSGTYALTNNPTPIVSNLPSDKFGVLEVNASTINFGSVAAQP